MSNLSANIALSLEIFLLLGIPWTYFCRYKLRCDFLTRPAEAARQEMLAPVEAQKGFSPPRPGESLFDNYANLADPLAFSTDEEEVDNLMRMGVGVRREASWDEERHREAVRQLVSIRRRQHRGRPCATVGPFDQDVVSACAPVHVNLAASVAAACAPVPCPWSRAGDTRATRARRGWLLVARPEQRRSRRRGSRRGEE